MCKGPRKLSSYKIINWDKYMQEVSSGKWSIRPACPKDKLEFEVFGQALRYWSYRSALSVLLVLFYKII